MTDFELNKAIAEALGLDCPGIEGGETKVCVNNGNAMRWFEVDYCNNWNDLMPLVVEHGLLESPTNIRHVVECDSGEVQLALAECLLKVLENKNE